MNNAQTGIDKDKVRVKTAADFNKEQEEKAKRAEEVASLVSPGVAPEVEKKAKVNKDGRFICANKGCKKRTFTDEENGDENCEYHTGEPIFHDLKKYWSCCNPNGNGKVAYDWDEFMALPTCTKGPCTKKWI